MRPGGKLRKDILHLVARYFETAHGPGEFIPRKSRSGYRVVGNLENTDPIKNDTFRVGVYPGISPRMAACIVETISGFASRSG